MTDIEAIIWDMGGIIYVTPFEAFDDIERRRGWPAGSLPRGPFSSEGDPEYARCSTGEISESEYWESYQQASEARGFPIDVKSSIDWTGRLRPEVMKTVETLGDHFVQATLSNDASVWLGQRWWESWGPAHQFDMLIDAATLGIRKPHPEAYRQAAHRLGVAIHKCLFIDDMQVNVDGSEAIGMPGFFFDHTDVVGSCDRLLERLGMS